MCNICAHSWCGNDPAGRQRDRVQPGLPLLHHHQAEEPPLPARALHKGAVIWYVLL